MKWIGVRSLPQGCSLKQPWTFLATWGGTGLLAPGPGTWGSLAAVPFGLGIHATAGQIGLAVAALLALALGVPAAGHVGRRSGEIDSGVIVIDEVCGVWLAMIPSTGNPLLVALAFVLFRIFDILKPAPIGWLERLPGGLGVMMDDVAAGIVAAAGVYGVATLIA